MQAADQRTNPYVGPRPFAPGEKDLFFGREPEINNVVNLVFAYGVVLLNAQSGAGKTSLINAGFSPRMIDEGHAVLRARIRDPLPAAAQPDPKSNFLVFKTLVSWNETDPNPNQFAQMTFAQYLERCERPVDDDGDPLLRILIFDQFEEIFTTHLRYWEDRNGFFAQLGEALRNDSQLRLLLVMREEYVSRLGAYADLLPDKLRIRYYLEHLRHDAAVLAITKPLIGTGRSFANDAAHDLAFNLSKIRVETSARNVEMIRGEFVEPVQLQIVCQNLWARLPDGIEVINRQHIVTFGDVSQALLEFYERSLKTTVERTRIGERELRDWIEQKFITPEGTPAIVYGGDNRTAGIPNPVVEMLEELRLIRSELRYTVPWYELSHDRFVMPILNSNRKWREKYLQDRWYRILAASLLIGLLLVVSVSVIGSITARNAEAQLAANATVQSLNVAQSDWLATRVAGLGGFPPATLTLTPEFLAKATTQAMIPRVKVENFEGTDMVFVPAGCFWMGYLGGGPDEQPAFEVCIHSPFWIDRYEVTNAQFDEIPNDAQVLTGSDLQAPRTGVTWKQAQDYCRTRSPNARLPSEVEWEYAARGPNSLLFPWGNTFVGDPNFVIYGGNSAGPRAFSPESPRNAGASWVGAYDMSGNVREWTSTIYDQERFPYPHFEGDGSDSLTDETLERVVRGGSFSSREYSDLTTARRGHKSPTRPFEDVGFRCLRPADDEAQN